MDGQIISPVRSVLKCSTAVSILPPSIEVRLPQERHSTSEPVDHAILYAQRPRRRGAFALVGVRDLDCVLEGLDRTRFDHFAFWPGFEHGLLFREGVDSFTFGCGGLRDC